MNPITRVWNFLTRPVTEEPSEALREYMLAAMLVSMAAITIVSTMLSLYGLARGTIPADTSVILGAMDVLFILGWYISRKGGWRISRFIPVALFMIAAVYGNYVGGMGAPAMLLYIIAITATTMLFSVRAQYAIIIICVVFFFGIAFLHHLGIIVAVRTDRSAFYNRVIIAGAAMLCIGILLRFLIRQLERSLDLSRVRETDLSAANEELQATIEEFEAQNEEFVRTNNDLEESDRYNRLLFSDSRVPMVVFDPDTSRFTDCNRAAVDAYGYETRDEVIGLTPIDVSAPLQYDGTDSPAAAGRAIARARMEGSHLFEWRHRRRNGTEWDAEVHLMTFSFRGKPMMQFTLRDITERRRMEREISDREERYRAFISKTSEGVWCWDVDEPFSVDLPVEAQVPLVMRGRITEANDALAHMYGFSRAGDMIGRSFGEFMTGEEFTGLSSLLAEARYNVSNVESEEIDRAGNRHFYINNSVGIVEGGRLIRVWGTQRDITERMRAETELLQEKQFSEKLLESLPGIFFLYDSTCHLKRWNKSHETAMGFTADELRDWYIPDWHETPEDAERGMALVRSVLETGVGGAFETTLINKQGTFVPYLISITRLETPGGPFMMGVGIDLTERIELEERIRSLNLDLEKKVSERTEELRRAYESIVTTNRELETALKNLHDTQHQLVQSEKLAALGQLAAGMAHELNTPLGAITSSNHSINNLIRRGLPMMADRITRWDKPGVKWFGEILAMSLAGAVSIEHTPNREIKREIREYLAEAGVVEGRALADAIADLDLFEYVKGNPALLNHRDLGEILDTITFISSVRNLGEVVSIAADKAAHVVGALRSYLRQDEPGDIALVDIRAELDMILTLYHNKLKYGVTVDRSYDKAGFVLGSRNKLNQVWMNLINNALQAMDFRGTLEVSAERRGEWTLVSIADSGPGISEEIRDHIFEPFFTTKRYGEGIGLGLDICSTIVETLGGRIQFTSVPGHTEFSVWLKAAEGPA